jgi:hypothetical protein
MSSLEVNKQEVVVEQGRAIARGMDEIQTQKEKNMAREAKRMKTMIRNAADKEMFK